MSLEPCLSVEWASQVAQWLRISLPMQGMQVQFLDREDPLEEEMANQSIILAWKIPWTEELGRLQSVGAAKSQMPLLHLLRWSCDFCLVCSTSHIDYFVDMEPYLHP